MHKTVQYYRIVGGARVEEDNGRQEYYVCSKRKKSANSCSSASIMTADLYNNMQTVMEKMAFIEERSGAVHRYAENKDVPDFLKAIKTHEPEKLFERILVGKDGVAQYHFQGGLVLAEPIQEIRGRRKRQAQFQVVERKEETGENGKEKSDVRLQDGKWYNDHCSE